MNFADFAAQVRQRPPMYFGRGGSAAIPCMIRSVASMILEGAPASYKGFVQVNIEPRGAQDCVTIEFQGLTSPLLANARAESWMDSLGFQSRWDLVAVAGASDRFKVENAGSNQLTRLHIRESKITVSRRPNPRKTPLLRVTFTPVAAIFGRMSHEEIYQVAGGLRDLALLRAGVTACFRADALASPLNYHYRKGLESFLFEEDITRWSLHPGVLSFKAARPGMSVEGCLRFLHAGTPAVWNYVNFQRTQGGAHLEGLGLALDTLFPDKSRGCRKVFLVTNPDTGAKVTLSHAFIGALHVQTDIPRYQGPTRDVLAGDEVRDFVREVALEQLGPQIQSALRKRA